jgi:hypothetical protein
MIAAARAARKGGASALGFSALRPSRWLVLAPGQDSIGEPKQSLCNHVDLNQDQLLRRVK